MRLPPTSDVRISLVPRPVVQRKVYLCIFSLLTTEGLISTRIPHIKVVLVVLPNGNVPLEMEMRDPVRLVWEAPHG